MVDIAQFRIVADVTDVRGAELALDRLAVAGQRVDAQNARLEASTRRSVAATREAASVTQLYANTLGLIGGAFVAREIASVTDEYIRYTNQLKVAGLEGGVLASKQEQLFAVAQKYGVQLEALGTVYGRVSQAQKELGATSGQLTEFSTGVAAAIKIQGSTAQASRGALIQLTQALGGTIVRAEEYNSINEGARPILQAVANNIDRYGGSLAKMRAEVIKGKLTSQEFFQAFLEGVPQLEKQAEKANLTIAQSFQTLDNALAKYFGDVNTATGATSGLAQAIRVLNENLDVIIPAATAAVAVLGVRWAAGAAQFVAAEISRQAAIAGTIAAERSMAIQEAQLEVQRATAQQAENARAAASVAAARADTIATLENANAKRAQALATIEVMRQNPAMLGAASSLAAATNALTAAERQRTASLGLLAGLGRENTLVMGQQTAAANSLAAANARLAAANATAGVAVTGLRGAGSALLGLMGGPWGAAMTALVGIYLLLQYNNQKYRQELELLRTGGQKATEMSDKLREAKDRLAMATDRNREKLRAETQELIANTAQQARNAQAALTAQRARLAAAIAEQKELQANERKLIEIGSAAGSIAGGGSVYGAFGAGMAQVNAERTVTREREKSIALTDRLAQLDRELAAAIDGVTASYNKQLPVAAATTKSKGDSAKATDKEKKATDEHKKALEELNGVREKFMTPYERKLKEFNDTQAILNKNLMNGNLAYEEWGKLSESNRYTLESLDGQIRVVDTSISGLRGNMEGAAKVEMQSMIDKAIEAWESFDSLAYSIENIGMAFRNGDWSGAVGGMLRAIKSITEAWKENKTQATLAMAAGFGQMIGGRAGSAISGAASGAMMGGQIATMLSMTGPWGMIAGGAIGLLGGLFGGNNQKKAQKKAEEERRRAEEERKALEIAKQAREFEIRIIELTQGSVAALAARRQDELKSVDASNRAALERIYQLEDEAAALEKLNSLRATFEDLFFTDAEKLASQQAKLAETLKPLNLSTEMTIEEFKALTLSLADAEGPMHDVYIAMLEAAPAFKAYKDAIAEVEDQSVAAAEAQAELAAQVAETAKTFAGDLLALFGGAGPTWQEQAASARSARLASERAADKAAKEAAAANAETLKAEADARAASRTEFLRLGNAAEALAIGFDDLKVNLSDFTDKVTGAINYDGFNWAIADARMKAAKRLAEEVSTNALRFMNAKQTFDSLYGQATYSDAVNIAQRNRFKNQIRNAAGEYGNSYDSVYVIRDAVSQFAETMADASIRFNSKYQPSGPGLANIRAAKEWYAFVGNTEMGRVGARVGRDVIEYANALDRLTGELQAGNITADQYAKALEAVNKIAGDASELFGNVEAQIERANTARIAVGAAGLESIDYYFEQVGVMAGELAASMKEASAPVAMMVESIGRLNSVADVFNESVSAAKYAPEMWGNNDTTNVAKASLISEAARMASEIINTREGAALASSLSATQEFAGLSSTKLRDVTSLMDGLKEFDAVSLENTLLRLNDALIRDVINMEQYNALVDRTRKVYLGMESVTGELAGSFAALRNTVRDLRNELLIDQGLTGLSPIQRLQDTERQYFETLRKAQAMDAQAISDLPSITKQLLETKQGMSGMLEYQLYFNQRLAELGPGQPNAPVVTGGNSGDGELKDLLKQLLAKTGEQAGYNKDVADAINRWKVTGMPTVPQS